ncbi:MAG TPA: hypothetical protein VH020_02455 [Stellaceae bacterium]|nr:hypothetical protein [Stellaceae bacterium]
MPDGIGIDHLTLPSLMRWLPFATRRGKIQMIRDARLAVLHHHGNVIADRQPAIAKHLGAALGARVQFAERHGFARRGHHDRGLVRRGRGMMRWVHERPLPQNGRDLNTTPRLGAREADFSLCEIS